jgi:hypothetical protein
MTQYQLLPLERTATMLDELAGIALSSGTLYHFINNDHTSVRLSVYACGYCIQDAYLSCA